MSRRTYSCLAIARRHGRMFAAMHAALGHFEAIPGSAAQRFVWPQVKPFAAPAQERREGPRSDSYFARLAEA